MVDATDAYLDPITAIKTIINAKNEAHASDPYADLQAFHVGVCIQARDLMRRKNTDYTGHRSLYENFELCERMNITDTVTGILTRMSDKFSRLVTLTRHDAACKDESIEDTVVDLINYAIIVAAYRKGIGRAAE